VNLKTIECVQDVYVAAVNTQRVAEGETEGNKDVFQFSLTCEYVPPVEETAAE
jgi:hypothetical protein